MQSLSAHSWCAWEELVVAVAAQVWKVLDGHAAASATAVGRRDEAAGLQKVDAVEIIKSQ